MALANFGIGELDAFADSLIDAGQKIKSTIEKMKLAHVDSLVLQAAVHLSIYGPAIFLLAGNIDSEFRDQYNAAQAGRPARWQMNQKKVEARAERRVKREGKPTPQTPAVVGRSPKASKKKKA